MAASQRSTGTVKWFSPRKGFGFIAPDDGSEDLFVHQTSIQSDGFRTLSEGQHVEYDVDFGGDDGAKASNVVGVSRSLGISRGRGSAGGTRGFPGGRGRRYNTGGGGGFGRGGRGGRFGGGGACYNCGRYGHLARDCYQGTAGGGGRRYGGGGGGGCYNCGEGHFARDCPNADQYLVFCSVYLDGSVSCGRTFYGEHTRTQVGVYLLFITNDMSQCCDILRVVWLELLIILSDASCLIESSKLDRLV